VTTTYTDGDGLRTDRTATAIFQDISDRSAWRCCAFAPSGSRGWRSCRRRWRTRSKSARLDPQRRRAARAVAVHGKDEQTLARLVMRESDRLSRLLSEFLDFARVRVARVEPIDVGRLCESAARLANASPNRPMACE
jgi:two-component system sensor histidine kinase PilS (NtrC family)